MIQTSKPFDEAKTTPDFHKWFIQICISYSKIFSRIHSTLRGKNLIMP